MTTLIARQQFTIDRIVNLREGPVRKGWSLAFSSIKRTRARAMTKVGYSIAKAWASVQDCVDMARPAVLARGGNPPLELC